MDALNCISVVLVHNNINLKYKYLRSTQLTNELIKNLDALKLIDYLACSSISIKLFNSMLN